jgi:putative Mn2+ efflux pump MntP
MKRVLQYGGIVSGLVLIVFGVVAIWMGMNGRSTVASNLKQEAIVGTPDMTPKAIAAEAKQAHLPASISLPTCTVANQAITNGGRAHCFASYMRIHALEATGGKTYAEMPRYATADGTGTNDAAKAQKDANGQPVDNGARNIWVTETALTTALNSAYMAEQLSTFGIVVGVALLLSGVGFVILALGTPLALRLWFRRPEASGTPVTAA